MATGYFITHPDVSIDPSRPIERWTLSPRGRQRMQALLSAGSPPGTGGGHYFIDRAMALLESR